MYCQAFSKPTMAWGSGGTVGPPHTVTHSPTCPSWSASGLIKQPAGTALKTRPQPSFWRDSAGEKRAEATQTNKKALKLRIKGHIYVYLSFGCDGGHFTNKGTFWVHILPVSLPGHGGHAPNPMDPVTRDISENAACVDEAVFKNIWICVDGPWDTCLIWKKVLGLPNE